MKVCSLDQLREGYNYWCGVLSEWRRWTLKLRELMLAAERDGTLLRPPVAIIRDYATMEKIKEAPIAANREHNDKLGYLPPIPTLRQAKAEGCIHNLRE